MNPFEKYQTQNRDNLVRTVGLSLDKFQHHWFEQIRIHQDKHSVTKT
jgi:hypothetical protein